MMKLFVTCASALKSRKGISALEYAILAGILVGVIGTAVTSFGTDITNLFTSAGSKLTLPGN
ncbi:MAG TPA: Flp family type IVb pilin [Rhodopila sp.]|nr:Flp family type IVb pilin [Rhodopila sp.]